jgi:hypothetical protein
MELAILEEVLKEMQREQKEIAADVKKGVEGRQEILLKLEEFGKRLDALKVPVNIDVSQVLNPIRSWIEEVKAKIVAQPVPVIQEKGFKFYKFIFGVPIEGLAISCFLKENFSSILQKSSEETGVDRGTLPD